MLFLSEQRGGGQGGRRRAPRLTFPGCPPWSLRASRLNKRRCEIGIPIFLLISRSQAYLLQLKIEEASWRLRSGDLGIPPNPEDRFQNYEKVFSWGNSSHLDLEAIVLILTTSDLQVLSLFMMEWEKDKTPAMLGSKCFFSQCSRKDRSYSIKKTVRTCSPSQKKSRIGKVQARRDRGNAG